MTTIINNVVTVLRILSHELLLYVDEAIVRVVGVCK